MVRGTKKTHRHNLIRDAILNSCSLHGISGIKEPPHYSSVTVNARPDAIIFLPTRELVLDVSVADPCAERNLPLEAASHTESLHRRAREKHARHDAVASSLGHTFKPFILSPQGVWHDEALEVVDIIARCVDHPQDFRADIVDAVSWAL